MSNKVYTSDFLVIGSGLSGLLFAMKASLHGKVHLVTKGQMSDSATMKAQGGIAAVVSPEDSIDLHIEDTIRVGDGLCHRSVVEEIVRAGPERIKDLVELGVDFCEAEKTGEYELGLEGGHSKRRVLHVKDHTGADIEKALIHGAECSKNVQIFENHMAVNLYVINNRVHGAYVLDENTNEVERFSAKVVILATGGAGRVFLYTSNPDVATGDGIAMAYRAGATVRNLEMVQFHPTLLYHHKVRSFLISEALRSVSSIAPLEAVHPFLGLVNRGIILHHLASCFDVPDCKLLVHKENNLVALTTFCRYQNRYALCFSNRFFFNRYTLDDPITCGAGHSA